MTTDVKAAIDALEGRIQDALKDMNEKSEAGERISREARIELDAYLKDHKQLVDEVKGLKQDVRDQVQDLIAERQRNADAEEKSIGKLFTEAPSFKSLVNKESNRAHFNVKNTIVNSGNTVSQHEQMSGVQGAAFRRLTVMPTVSQGTTGSNIVYYSQENAWTNNAAPQAGEGAAKAESALTFVEVNKPVQTIAHFLKVSKQAIDDSAFLSSFIDQRMRHGVNLKVETQVISGDGTGNNLSGWLASGNSTATVATGTGNIFGLANKMKYEIIGADYEADYFYMNPTDWATMELTQRGAGDASYVAGSGAISYVNNGMQPLLWGLPVIMSNNIPAGTIVCKSLMADMYLDREDTSIEMFEQDEDNAQKNLYTVRAETRGVACNFAPAAIRTGAIASIT